MALQVVTRHHISAHESISSAGSEMADTIEVKAGSSTDSARSSLRSSPNDDIQTATTHTSASIYPSNDDSSHKRKRSGDDPGTSSPPRGYDYNPPTRTEHPQHVANRALHMLGTSNDPTQDYHTNGNGITNGREWEDRYSPEPQSASTHTPNGDEQQRWESNGHGQNYNHDSMSGANGVRARKRNFSNRTKTGCLTCRQRKKKCDEARPHCMNCIRGSFKCAGYSTTRTSGLWPKPPATKVPVPLQSKDGHGDIEAAIQPHSSSSPGSRRSLDGYQARPAEEAPYHQYATTPSTEPRNRPPYSGQGWPPQQGPPQYTKDQFPPMPDYSRPEVPGNTHTHEMSRPPTQGSSVTPLAQAPQQNPPPQQHPPQASAQPPQYQAQPAPPPQQHAPQPAYYPPQTEYRQSYGTPHPPPVMEYTSSMGHQRASSGYDRPVPSLKTLFTEDIERSRMLRNRPYNHLDKTLINERQRCERALARYNSACKIDSGMDMERARELLWQVFDPSKDTTHHFLTRVEEKGTLSHGIHIESPFSCTYGYNLRIMDSCFIGKGTTIDDAAVVEIGARTWIGPDVTILTSACVPDLIDRKGSGGFWQAKSVYIGPEVVIGAGAVIYPDIRLERGVTVEPYAIVKESCLENELVKAFGGQRGPSRP